MYSKCSITTQPYQVTIVTIRNVPAVTQTPFERGRIHTAANRKKLHYLVTGLHDGPTPSKGP